MKNYVICGSSRAGKTTLVRKINQQSTNVQGFIFEGLFPAYLSKFFLNSKAQTNLETYFSHPRNISEHKHKTIIPKNFINPNSLVFSDEPFLKQIEKIFNRETERLGYASWAIADLHAEFYYKDIIQKMESVCFIAPIRDPRESIAAALYWRTFPEETKARNNWFYVKLMNWLLSAAIIKRLNKRYPQKTFVFDVGKKSKLADGYGMDAILEKIGLKKSTAQMFKMLHFTIIDENLFTTPDNKKERLLSNDELFIIEKLAKPFFDIKNQNNGPIVKYFLLKTVFQFLNLFSYVSPPFAFRIITLIFHPRIYVEFQIQKFKRAFHDIFRK